MRGHFKPRRVMPWGPEAKCSRCRGWWPDDTEFFKTLSTGRLSSWCKACNSEYERERRSARPVKVANQGARA